MLPSTHRWLHFKELNRCQRQIAISMEETQASMKENQEIKEDTSEDFKNSFPL